MILGEVKVTDITGTTDRAELAIDGSNKIVSSEYGQKDIKSAVSAIGGTGIAEVKHPLYWSGTLLVGNPW